MSSNVRISETTHRRLRELAEKERTTMQTVIERALENYRRDRFLTAANERYAALRADDGAWAKEQTEREMWDGVSTADVEDQ